MRVVKALAALAVVALLAGCRSAQLPVIAPAPSPTPAYSEAERNEMLTAIARDRTTYDGALERLGQLPLADAMALNGAVQEYRVLQSRAKSGYDYCWFGVFDDGTGRFVSMTLAPETARDSTPDNVEIQLDAELSIGETQAMLDVMSRCDFLGIPPKHPDEQNGDDGSTTFIEGSDGERTQFAKMWQAPPSYPIAQIRAAMQEFAEAHIEQMRQS